MSYRREFGFPRGVGWFLRAPFLPKHVRRRPGAYKASPCSRQRAITAMPSLEVGVMLDVSLISTLVACIYTTLPVGPALCEL